MATFAYLRVSTAAQATEGESLGTPFGFAATEAGELIENPAEQKALSTMRRLRTEGRGYLSTARAVAEIHGIELIRSRRSGSSSGTASAHE